MSGTTELRLIGAKNFTCRPCGIIFPVEAGEVVEVDDQHVEYLLEQTYKVGKHSVFNLFSRDLEADVQLNLIAPMPVGERAAKEGLDQAVAEAEQKAAEAIAAAEKRAEDAEARIDRLEARMAAQDTAVKEAAPTKPAKANKKAASRTRARKSTGAQAPASA